jgi:opacity protein-like surface antigen
LKPALLATAMCLLLPEANAAKQTQGAWYLGGNLAFHSTQDTVRSNADLGKDPRPDDFVSREMAAEDGVSYGLTAGFGVTKWLALQLDVGYYQGRIGPIDAFLQDRFPFAPDPTNPSILAARHERETTVSFNAGRLTEIPVSLSGIIRFRTDRPVNPYVGIGAGMIYSGVDGSAELDAFNARLDKLRITGEKDEFLNDLVPERFETLRAQGRIPYTYPMSLRTGNSFEWHLQSGVEYFLGDRFSLVGDLRYTFATQSLFFELQGEDQVDIAIYSEKLFRPDGSLRIFNSTGMFPNPLVDPNDLSKGVVRCQVNTVGDFDHDGHLDDVCYFNDNLSKQDDPVGTLVVQGGRVNMSGFTAHLALRIYF